MTETLQQKIDTWRYSGEEILERVIPKDNVDKAIQEFREQINKSTNYYWTNDGEPWLQKKDVLALLGEK